MRIEHIIHWSMKSIMRFVGKQLYSQMGIQPFPWSCISPMVNHDPCSLAFLKGQQWHKPQGWRQFSVSQNHFVWLLWRGLCFSVFTKRPNSSLLTVPVHSFRNRDMKSCLCEAQLTRGRLKINEIEPNVWQWKVRLKKNVKQITGARVTETGYRTRWSEKILPRALGQVRRSQTMEQ